MKRGVIFDVGGVLAYDVWEHLLCDRPPQSLVDPVSIAADPKFAGPANQLAQLDNVGNELWSRFDCVKGDPGTLENDYWQQFLAHPQCPPALTSVPVSTFISKTEEFIRPVNPDQTTLLLEWIVRKGVYLGICSNNNEFWFLRQVTKLGLYRFFGPNNITLSCHHEINKRDYRLFHIAAHAVGLHPTECVFVDDRKGNVSRSLECGMTGVLFPSEQFASQPQHGAEYLWGRLDAILA
jgi:FMN phosphatase YigB (HAD superfamily)